jgi:hypothetical protein
MSLQNPSTVIYGTTAFAITTSGDPAFPEALIYVGVTGDVAVLPAGATNTTPVVFKGVAAGQFVPCMVKQLFATGTTATNLVRVA